MKSAYTLSNPACGTLAGILFTLILTGCQSNPSEVLAVDPASQSTQQSATQSSSNPVSSMPGTVGSGPLRIAYVIAAGTPAGNQTNEIRNAAELALSGLDDGKMSAEFLSASGTPTSVNERAVEAFVRGASAIVYVGMASPESAGSALQISLLPNGYAVPAGAFSFLSSPVDSLESGLRQALNAGASSAYLISNQSDANSSQVSSALGRLKQSGSIQLLTYGNGESAASIAAKVGTGAGAVVGFAGNSPEIGQIATAIKASSPSVQFIGNSSWQGTGLLASPALQGALIATPDNSNEKLIADKYRQKFGQAPSAVAFQVYDTVAIIAGINRAKGKGGLTDGTIKTNAGFKGATGSFRFRSDGTVDRLFALKAVKNGQLALLSPAPPRF